MLTNGVSGSKRYHAYGATRSGSVPSEWQYTGQELDGGTGLVYMHARYYDPATGQFLSPDTLVPEPGSVLSYNRYMYTRGNPLNRIDPSGRQDCGASTSAWEDCNRWYNAHGFFFDALTNHWSVVGEPVFATRQILDQTLAEAGVTWSSIGGQVWNFAREQKIAGGVVRFAQAFQAGATQGLIQLRNLLGGGAVMQLEPSSPSVCNGGTTPCALDPSPPHLVHWPVEYVDNFDATIVGQTTVHELAHVVDYVSTSTGQGFSIAWSEQAGLTAYANCGLGDCLPWLEKWAEAVTTWVYGPSYALSSPNPRMSSSSIQLQSALQSNQIEVLLDPP